jgi:hypothetical protein
MRPVCGSDAFFERRVPREKAPRDRDQLATLGRRDALGTVERPVLKERRRCRVRDGLRNARARFERLATRVDRETSGGISHARR